MTAVVLAGGQGTRLRPLTQKIPKPLVPVANVPLIVWTLEKIRSSGIKRVVILSGQNSLDLGVWRQHLSQGGLDIEFLREPSPLGTGGALALAAEQYTGTLLCCNGDLIWDFDLKEAMSQHEGLGARITVVVREILDPSRYGLLVSDEKGRVKAWLEKPSPEQIKLLSSPHRINAGFYMLDSRLFSEFGFQGAFSIEKNFFPRAIQGGIPFRTYSAAGYWKDLGTAESFLQANQDVLDNKIGVLPSLEKFQGTWIRDSDNEKTNLRGPVLMGPGAQIDPGAVVGPGVVLGRSSKVAKGARLQNSVVCDNSEIGEGAVLDQVIVGPGVHVAPDAKPEPGDILI